MSDDPFDRCDCGHPRGDHREGIYECTFEGCTCPLVVEPRTEKPKPKKRLRVKVLKEGVRPPARPRAGAKKK